MYIGSTTDLQRRLREHQAGRGGAYTRRHRPVVLLYSEAQPDRRAAQRRELELKRWPHARKLALAAGTRYCLFCGAPLASRARGARLACPRCRAVFTAARNGRGCLVALRVSDCGAGPECCQQRRRGACRM